MKHSKKDLKSKAKILFEGFRGEASMAEVCCRGVIVLNPYYRWSNGLSIGRKRM